MACDQKICVVWFGPYQVQIQAMASTVVDSIQRFSRRQLTCLSFAATKFPIHTKGFSLTRKTKA